jgi:hypothetical protein
LSTTTPQHDPLAAVPVIPPTVTAQTGADGRLRLWREVPPRTALGRLLARRLHWVRRRGVELDERGTRFWREIDGRRSLHAIARRLHVGLRTPYEESERAVIEFTRQLMLRGLVALRLPGMPVHNQHAAHGERT